MQPPSLAEVSPGQDIAPRRPVARNATLDLLRGWAAVLMIVNHAGASLLGIERGSTQPALWLVTLGSFAPALFFYATGVGIGLSSRKPEVWLGLAPKLVALVLADVLLGHLGGRMVGLDFFGFIALSMVVATLVRRTERPLWVAGVLVLALLTLRYAPLGEWRPDRDSFVFLRWLAGGAVADVSYPASPWFVAPLVGVMTGTLLRTGQHLHSTLRWGLRAAFVAGLLVLGYQFCKGAPFDRWGAVSVTYFVAAVYVVWASWALAAIGARSVAVSRWLSLTGEASFLVVPIHYALIHLCHESLGLARLGDAPFLVLTVAIVIVAWVLSVAGARVLSTAWFARHQRAAQLVALLASVGTLSAFVLGDPSRSSAMVAASFLCQIALASLFVVGTRRAKMKDLAVQTTRT